MPPLIQLIGMQNCTSERSQMDCETYKRNTSLEVKQIGLVANLAEELFAIKDPDLSDDCMVIFIKWITIPRYRFFKETSDFKQVLILTTLISQVFKNKKKARKTKCRFFLEANSGCLSTGQFEIAASSLNDDSILAAVTKHYQSNIYSSDHYKEGGLTFLSGWILKHAKTQASSFFPYILSSDIAKEINISEKSVKMFEKKQMVFERRIILNGLELFRKGLRHDICKLLHGFSRLTVAHYNYFFAENNLKIRRNRVQAAETYPLIADVLVNDKKLDLFRYAIDHGKPIKPVLSYLYQIDPKCISALKNHWRGLGHHYCLVSPEYFLNAVASIPKNWHPRNRQSWKGFLEFYGAFYQNLDYRIDLCIPTLLGSHPHSKDTWTDILRDELKLKWFKFV